jgi:hypothetical protein
VANDLAELSISSWGGTIQRTEQPTISYEVRQSYGLSGITTPGNFELQGCIVYIGDHDGGSSSVDLAAYDISEPDYIGAPVSVQEVYGDANVRDFAIHGNYAL